MTPEREYDAVKLVVGCGLLVFGVALDSLFLGVTGFLFLLSLD